MKIGNKHVSDQGEGVLARASPNSLDAFSRPGSHEKTGLRVWLLPTTSLLLAFNAGLSHICQFETNRFPTISLSFFFFLVRTVMVVNPTGLATCWSLIGPWANNL